MSPVDERANEILRRLNGGPVRGAEIGIFIGQLSRALLKRPGLFLYMVDSWQGKDDQPERYRNSGDYHNNLNDDEQRACMEQAIKTTDFAAERREVLHMDSLQAAAIIENGSLDFVFIDADHTYEGCWNDISAWIENLKPGGLLGGHDYDFPGHPKMDVKGAVSDFVKATNRRLELGADTTWFVKV